MWGVQAVGGSEAGRTKGGAEVSEETEDKLEYSINSDMNGVHLWLRKRGSVSFLPILREDLDTLKTAIRQFFGEEAWPEADEKDFRYAMSRIKCLEMIIRGEAVPESEVILKEDKLDCLVGQEPMAINRACCKSCSRFRGYICTFDKINFFERCTCGRGTGVMTFGHGMQPWIPEVGIPPEREEAKNPVDKREGCGGNRREFL